MTSKHPGRRVRNYLINREYQFRFVGQMVAVALTLTALLGYMIHRFNQEASRIVDVRALDPTDVEAKAIREALQKSEVRLLAGLVAFAVVLAVLLAAWQIVHTHRVAGPLYYISHQIKRIRDGYLGKLHGLRKDDLLHGFFETFREMHDAMRSRAQAEAEQFARLAERAEAAGQAEVGAELRALQKAREDSLK